MIRKSLFSRKRMALKIPDSLKVDNKKVGLAHNNVVRPRKLDPILELVL